jgi:hypothetical protein
MINKRRYRLTWRKAVSPLGRRSVWHIPGSCLGLPSTGPSPLYTMWDELANRHWVQMAGTAPVVAKEVKRDKN